MKNWNPFVKEVAALSETRLFSKFQAKLQFKPGGPFFSSRYSKLRQKDLFHGGQSSDGDALFGARGARRLFPALRLRNGFREGGREARAARAFRGAVQDPQGGRLGAPPQKVPEDHFLLLFAAQRSRGFPIS